MKSIVSSSLVLSLLGSIYVVNAAPAENCDDQKNCITWSITTANKPSTCTSGVSCDFKVCATINAKGVNGCVKDGGWSHGYVKSPNTCPAVTFNGATYVVPTAGRQYCETVPAGSKAQFIFKDGNGCKDLSTGSVSLGGVASATCRGSLSGDNSPSGGGNIGQECVWEVSTSASSCGTSGGGGGDPHFRTYDGTVYSYHGECDLIMTRSASFDNGLGLDVHTRTNLFADSWSLISNAAIRIGTDVFELTNQGVTYLNRIEHIDYPFEMANKFTVTKEIELVEEATNEWNESFEAAPQQEERVHYIIDLGSRTDASTDRVSTDQIYVSLYRNMISVRVDAHMADAEGMLGIHDVPGLVGRDHQTVFTNVDDMGSAWQVQPNVDGNLFAEVGSIRYPEECVLPTVSMKTQVRRLRMSVGEDIIKKAQTACAKVSPEMHSLCVDDVLRTGDFNMANGFAF